MNAKRPIRSVLGLVLCGGVAALSGCAQARLSELADQLAVYEKYTAHMEGTYAAQEAEILALRQEVATLRSRNQAP